MDCMLQRHQPKKKVEKSSTGGVRKWRKADGGGYGSKTFGATAFYSHLIDVSGFVFLLCTVCTRYIFS